MQRKILKLLSVFVLAGFAGWLISPPGPRQAIAATLGAQKTAPAWELKDVNGKTLKSSDFKGKVVVLDFWATWCPPCRAEIPGFVELQKKYSEQGLTIVGISLDEKGPSVVKPFMKKFNINYPVVMGDDKVVEAFGGVESIPTTFVIDRTGKIVSKHVGLAEKSQFEKEIRPLLNEKPVANF
jgi:peroxiredoxin